MTLNEILGRFQNVKPAPNGGYLALCPAHDDRNPSLKIDQTDGGKILLKCFAGCDTKDVIRAAGLNWSDLSPNGTGRPKAPDPIIRTYDYHDASGNLLFRVCRTAGKKFFQQRPDGRGGWFPGLGKGKEKVRPVLYQLPQVLEAVKAGKTIYIVEGEKDANNLAALGLVATTNPMGSCKWRSHYGDCLEGATCIILPDNDEAGRDHARQVAESLSGKAASVKVLELPGLPAKGDVSDWLAAGGTKEELLKLVADCPEWEFKQTDEVKNKSNDEEKSPIADILVKIAAGSTFLFHDDYKDGFANLPINGHKETWPLRSKFFKQWLVRQFYEQTEKSPNNEALRQALNVIEAKAVFDGPEIRLSLRVAENEGTLWYDLANEYWQAVKIAANGWKVINDPPILFRHFKNTAAQVLPERGGSLDLLEKYINLKDDEDWLLLIALVVYAFIPGVPHAIPVFYGDKGAAKTTAQRVIRKLVDPAMRDTMTLPTDKNELALVLMTNYAPCFDNLDGLSPWQSDMLCQAATGGGISKRELYTDMDEVILSFLRCPMLNGINLVASRDDLLDRSVLFKLERIDEEERKTESEFWQEFEDDRPYILGAIFDVLAKALQIYPKVKLPSLPRMADFAAWGYAIMEAAGGMGEVFLKAYRRNIVGAVEEAVTNDIVGAAIVEFMGNKDEWQGTASELLSALNELPSVNKKDKAWPKRPNTLTRRLNRIKSALADYGIKTTTDARTATQRLIHFQKLSTLSSLLSYRHKSINSKPLSNDDIVTINDDNEKISSSLKPLINQAHDDNNANDDISPNSQKSDNPDREVWEI